MTARGGACAKRGELHPRLVTGGREHGRHRRVTDGVLRCCRRCVQTRVHAGEATATRLNRVESPVKYLSSARQLVRKSDCATASMRDARAGGLLERHLHRRVTNRVLRCCRTCVQTRVHAGDATATRLHHGESPTEHLSSARQPLQKPYSTATSI